MSIITKKIKFSTQGDTDILDITAEVSARVKDSGLSEGTVTVFIPGATGGITTLEYEPGLVKDLQRAFEEIASKDREYAHNDKWKDMNGFSHIRASLLGPSLTVPFSGGKLQLGTWQQIVFVEFDDRPRDREVILKISGER